MSTAKLVALRSLILRDALELTAEEKTQLYRLFKSQNVISKPGLRVILSPAVLYLLRIFYPGVIDAFIRRKNYFRNFVEKEIANESKQLLVLGAGFDTLGITLCRKYSDLVCIEIDIGEVAETKSRLFPELPNSGNWEIDSLNLESDNLLSRLQQSERWDAQVNTTIIAEGVLMYLNPIVVTRVLKELSCCVQGKARLIFSSLIMDNQIQTLFRRVLLEAGLKVIGAPIKWCPESPAAICSELEVNGWIPVSPFDYTATEVIVTAERRVFE